MTSAPAHCVPVIPPRRPGWSWWGGRAGRRVRGFIMVMGDRCRKPPAPRHRGSARQTEEAALSQGLISSTEAFLIRFFSSAKLAPGEGCQPRGEAQRNVFIWPRPRLGAEPSACVGKGIRLQLPDPRVSTTLCEGAQLGSGCCEGPLPASPSAQRWLEAASGCQAPRPQAAPSHRGQRGEGCSKHLSAPHKSSERQRWPGPLPYVQRHAALAKLWFEGACPGWPWDGAQGIPGDSKVERINTELAKVLL